MANARLNADVVRFGEHLFITGDTNAVNDQHRGLLPTPKDVKDEWKNLIRDRHKRLIIEGIAYLFILAPDKQTVYRHLLPAEFNNRETAYLLDLEPVLDLSPLLTSVAPFCDVYPRVDSHWNQFGAMLAAQSVMSRFGRRDAMPAIRWSYSERTGDLGNKLTPPEKTAVPFARVDSPATLVYDNRVPNNGRIIVHCRTLLHRDPDRKNTVLVLFGDSFAYHLVHFLREFFDVVVQIHSIAIDWRFIDELKPDYVITEVTERFMIHCPRPPDGLPLDTLLEKKVDAQVRLEPINHAIVPSLDTLAKEARTAIQIAEQVLEPYGAMLVSF